VGLEVRIDRDWIGVDGDGRFEASVPAGHYERLYVGTREIGPAPVVERAFDVGVGDAISLGDIPIALR
jgi:hypothetical protein